MNPLKKAILFSIVIWAIAGGASYLMLLKVLRADTIAGVIAGGLGCLIASTTFGAIIGMAAMWQTNLNAAALAFNRTLQIEILRIVREDKRGAGDVKKRRRKN